jgi:hypothetical protein
MSRSYSEAKESVSTYWKKKPVLQMGCAYTTNEVIDNELSEKVSKKEIELPKGYQWKTIDVSDSEFIKLADFIKVNQKRTNDQHFLSDYTAESIVWQMGGRGKFIVIEYEGKDESNLQICSCIGYTSMNVQIYDETKLMTVPFFLTVGTKYRSRGMSKLLIDRLIIESARLGIMCGCFATNKIVPSPIVQLRHYSRPLNYEYLYENGFVDIDDVSVEVAHEKTRIRLRPPPNYLIAKRTPENIEEVHRIYCESMKSYSLHICLSLEDIEHYFFNDKFCKVILIYKFVEETKTKSGTSIPVKYETMKPVDFLAYNFFDIINTKNVDHNRIKCANILMYSSLKTREDIVVINSIKHISLDGMDVVQMSDQMNSTEVLLTSSKYANEDTDEEDENSVYDLHFLKTEKKTMINLFNWKCNLMKPGMVSWLTF